MTLPPSSNIPYITRATNKTAMALLDSHSDSTVWFLKTTSLFQDQSESILDWASQSSRELDFSKGDVIPLTGEGGRNIYILVDGQVKLRTFTESGKEKILDIAGPGDTFGPLDHLVSFNSRESRDSPDGMAKEAVAISKGSTLAYSLAEFRDLIARRPIVVLNVSRLLGLKQRRMEIRLNRLLFRSSLGKVAGLLAELAERYGEREADASISLNFKPTHQEMASMIGVKRETVSECLATLELDEFISTRNRRITILKLDALDDIL